MLSGSQHRHDGGGVFWIDTTSILLLPVCLRLSRMLYLASMPFSHHRYHYHYHQHCFSLIALVIVIVIVIVILWNLRRLNR